MTYESLQQQWQSQPGPGRITIDETLLLKQVRRDKTSFEVGIFLRDVREGGIALALSPLFLYFAVRDHMWTHYVLSAGCLFVAAFLWLDRRRQKSKRPQTTDTVQDCLRSSLHQVKHQIHLLRNVFWWYLLPIMVGGILQGAHAAVRFHDRWQDVLKATLMSIATWAILGTVIWGLNQVAVKKFLEPYRQELAELLESLSAD
jgi:hypothetical protein